MKLSKVNQQDLEDYFDLINKGYSQRKAALVLGIARTVNLTIGDSCNA